MNTNTYKIKFQLLQNFGLSLNTNKKYFIVYEPFCWSLTGVYDNIEDAIKVCHNGSTIDQYYEKCANADYDQYGVKYDEHYVGHNYPFCKGLFQNINVWQLLNMLGGDIMEDMVDDDMEGSKQNILDCIDSKLRSKII